MEKENPFASPENKENPALERIAKALEDIRTYFFIVLAGYAVSGSVILYSKVAKMFSSPSIETQQSSATKEHERLRSALENLTKQRQEK